MKWIEIILCMLIVCSGCASMHKSRDEMSGFAENKTSSSSFEIVTSLDKLVKGKVNICVRGINDDIDDDGMLPISTNTKVRVFFINLSEEDVVLMTRPNILRINWTEITTDTQTYLIHNPVIMPADYYLLHAGVWLRHASYYCSHNSHSVDFPIPSALESFNYYFPPPYDIDIEVVPPKIEEIKRGKLEILFTLKYMRDGSFKLQEENLRKTIKVVCDKN